MNCSNCGKYVPDGATFCTSCGTPTSGQPQAPPPPPPQQPYQQPPPQYQQPPPQYQQPPPQQPYPPPYPQQYQQPLPHRPPPTDDTGTLAKVALIIIVVVVVVIVVAAAIFWFAIFSIVDDNIGGDVTVNLASPSVTIRDIGGTTYWDAVVNINKVTPGGALVSWVGTSVIVKNDFGQVLLERTNLVRNNPTMYDDDSDGTVDAEAWYVDTNSDMFVSSGDSFKLTGLTDDYEGATVEMYDFTDRIASTVLPTDFP